MIKIRSEVIFWLNNKKKNAFFLLLYVVFALGCSKYPKITKNNIMEAFTIGWNKGYQEGLRQGYNYRESGEWKESAFMQDSCFMELHLNGIK